MAIQIIDENRRRGIGQALVGGIAEGLPEAIGRFQDYQRLQNENQAIKNQLGLDLTGIMDPSTRQALIADQLKFGRAMKQAEASKNVNYTGQNPPVPQKNRLEDFQNLKNELPRVNKKELPEFGNFSNRPSNKNSQPQTKTTLESNAPLTDTNELYKRGLQIAEERRLSGIPTDDLEGIEIARTLQLGENVDKKERVAAQRDYGNIANLEIDKRLANEVKEVLNSPKIRTAVKKEAEQLAQTETSEAKIQEKIAKRVEDISNKISIFKNSIPRGNIAAKIGRTLTGSDRGQKAIADMRRTMKPLLDMGLHDEVRAILYDHDFRPEMTESFISDLGENAQKIVADLPVLNPEKPWYTKLFEPAKQPWQKEKLLEPKQYEQFSENLANVLQKDPNANLILLRKAYADKGVNWEDFEAALTELQNEGVFQPTEDQFKMLNDLTQPPLDGLDRIFKTTGLIDII